MVAPLGASPLHRRANDVDSEQARAATRAAAVAGLLGVPHVRVARVAAEDPVAAVDEPLHTSSNGCATATRCR